MNASDPREQADLVEIDRLLRALPRMEPSDDVLARTRAAVETQRAGWTWGVAIGGLVVAAALLAVGVVTLAPREAAPLPVAVHGASGSGEPVGGYWVPAMGAAREERTAEGAVEPARTTFEATIGALPSDGSMQLSAFRVTRGDALDYRAAERAAVTDALREAAGMSRLEARARLVASLGASLSEGDRALVSGFADALAEPGAYVQVVWSMRLAVALREAAAGD